MKIDLQEIQALVDKRLVSTQKHPKLPLLIHNYTQSCQFERAWDDLTVQCRGLITDLEGNVVARPFSKFFNLGEHEGDDSKLSKINWKQEFYVTEKLDGSLGIIYPTADGYAIATRGSFTSEQAVKGTQMLKSLHFNFNPAFTYLFEIIYPENRIVVDYGKHEGLTLLDVIETETGKSVYNFEKFAREIGCDAVFDLKLPQESLSKLSGENREGVVVRFEDGTRIKIKLEEYCRLHKLITGVNARHIWECLMKGDSMDDLLDRVPDEFFQWVQETKRELLRNYKEIEDAYETKFSWISQVYGTERKTFAIEATKESHPSILFAMLDKKDHAPIIWRLIKPAHTLPFNQDIDA